MVTRDQLAAIMPAAKANSIDTFLDPINGAMDEYGIDTPARQAMFLAQIAHETMELRYVHELWGPTPTQMRYDPPDELGKSLGNLVPGDGRKFLGRGLIQVTGRGNYRSVGEALGLDLMADPTQLEQPVPASRSAGYFWQSHNLNDCADNDDINKCTRIINGGYNGLAQRIAYWIKAKGVLGA